MSELLFECYNVPAVSYGVDALFSLYHSCSVQGRAYCDALVICSGHQSTHILPVLDGRLDASHVKRYLSHALYMIASDALYIMAV